MESLTVQILGDSSGLQQELNSVADLLDGLEQQLSGATAGASDFGNALGSLSAALGPLQAVSTQLSSISQQIQQLSAQPVSLNVEPALNSLAQLVQAAQSAAAQLAALSNATLPGLPVGPAPLPGDGFPTGVRGFASGGMVDGPTGVDQVPAWLTAGEFVMNRSAVASLGANELDRWNRGETPAAPLDPDRLQRPFHAPPTPAASLPRPMQRSVAPVPTSTSQTMNNFGGIEIHVKTSSELPELMSDLRRQGIGLRKRWG